MISRTPPEMILLKEKVALCTDFTAEERNLILDSLNLGDYTGAHTYPKNHGPGTSPWATGAWAILDQIAPEKLSRSDRYMIAGMIAGALSEMYQAGRKHKTL